DDFTWKRFRYATSGERSRPPCAELPWHTCSVQPCFSSTTFWIPCHVLSNDSADVHSLPEPPPPPPPPPLAVAPPPPRTGGQGHRGGRGERWRSCRDFPFVVRDGRGSPRTRCSAGSGRPGNLHSDCRKARKDRRSSMARVARVRRRVGEAFGGLCSVRAVAAGRAREVAREGGLAPQRPAVRVEHVRAE